MEKNDVRLTQLIQSFDLAVGQLQKALDQPKNEFVRDSAIQRFEFTFELFWKILKEYCHIQGLEYNSPRESIRGAFRLGILADDAIYLDMLNSRNLASHTYEESIAEDIYSRLPQYLQTTKSVVKVIREKNLDKE
jgi:nucleotidyltransferase substrate binding protein (TIGR01987 family)